jgi:hypothetical protein
VNLLEGKGESNDQGNKLSGSLIEQRIPIIFPRQVVRSLDLVIDVPFVFLRLLVMYQGDLRFGSDLKLVNAAFTYHPHCTSDFALDTSTHSSSASTRTNPHSLALFPFSKCRG